MASGSKGSSVLSYGRFKEGIVSVVLWPPEVRDRQCCLMAVIRKGSSVLSYSRFKEGIVSAVLWPPVCGQMLH